MQLAVLPIPLDKYGGISNLDPISQFSESNDLKKQIRNYLQSKLVVLNPFVRASYWLYRLGFLLLILTIVMVLLLTQYESTVILVFMVAFPVSLIFVWGLAAHFESKWKKSILQAQKDVLRMSNNCCSLELGYVPRFGSKFEKEKSLFNYRHSCFLLFDIARSKIEIKRNQLVEVPELKTRCLLSINSKTSFEKMRSRQKKKQKTSNTINNQRRDESVNSKIELLPIESFKSIQTHTKEDDPVINNQHSPRDQYPFESKDKEGILLTQDDGPEFTDKLKTSDYKYLISNDYRVAFSKVSEGKGEQYKDDQRVNQKKDKHNRHQLDLFGNVKQQDMYWEKDLDKR